MDENDIPRPSTENHEHNDVQETQEPPLSFNKVMSSADTQAASTNSDTRVAQTAAGVLPNVDMFDSGKKHGPEHAAGSNSSEEKKVLIPTEGKTEPRTLRTPSELKDEARDLRNGVDKIVGGFSEEKQNKWQELKTNKDGTYSREQLDFLAKNSKDAYLKALDHNQIRQDLNQVLRPNEQAGLKKAEMGVDKALGGMSKELQGLFNALGHKDKMGNPTRSQGFSEAQMAFLKTFSPEGYAAAQDFNRLTHQGELGKKDVVGNTGGFKINEANTLMRTLRPAKR